MEGGNERNLNRKRQRWNERKNGRKWNQTGKIYIAERGGIKMTIRYRRIHVKILDTSFGYSPLALPLTWSKCWLTGAYLEDTHFTLLPLPYSHIELTYVLAFLGFILFSYEGTCRGIPRGIQQWSFRHDLPAWFPFAATSLLAALLLLLPCSHNVRFHPRPKFNPEH